MQCPLNAKYCIIIPKNTAGLFKIYIALLPADSITKKASTITLMMSWKGQCRLDINRISAS